MKKLKQKLRIFILSHIFKHTYQHYCSLLNDCKQLTESSQCKDAEITRLREISLNQEKEIISLKELNQFNDEKNIQYLVITETKDQQIKQLMDQNHNLELQVQQLIERNQQYEIQNKQCNENTKKSLELIQLLECYIIGKGTNNFSSMSSFSYDCLHRILETDKLNGSETFKIVTTDIYKFDIEIIKKKPKIKVAFLSPLSSTWSCDSIYRKLASDSRFDTYIIVVPFEYGQDRNTIDTEYIANCDFFEKKKYRYIKSYDVKKKKYLTFEEAGVPDIVFQLTPHTAFMPDNFKIDSLHLNVLNVYIPYGYMIVNEYDMQFNQKSHHLFWKIFCETPLHKKMAMEHSLIRDINVECSGYVKMDQLLDDSKIERADNIWKIPRNKNKDEIIKIIWAPHHALVQQPSTFGTFHKNYMFFYELAKSMPGISWIVKPHPLLKNDSIHFGIFKDSLEFNEYMKRWDDLPNARTVQDGNYIDIFKTSDAMILDSVSFLAEYLFTQKPSLFLTKSSNTFNDFGQVIKESHYQTDGENFEEIKSFIYNVLIQKNDSKREIREEIYNKYLNFNNGIYATEYIYKYLLGCFEN